MEMRRYIRHSAAWWIVAAVLLAVTAGCAVLGVLRQKGMEAVEPTPLPEGEVYLDDYHYIDVQYMTEWIYKVTHGDGDQELFYIAWDAEGYGYLVRLDEAQFARFSDIVAYTAGQTSDLLDVTGQSDEPLSPLSADIPGEGGADTLAEPTDKPAPVRLSGMICATPEDYIADIASKDGTTSEEFITYYGDYYIDATKKPTDLDNDFLGIALLALLFAVIFLAQAMVYSVQLGRELKRLKKAGLLERAESEFHYLQGDLRSDALVSTAFIYGRRQNLALPLADVLWVYRHETKMLGFRSMVVQLLTYDGRSYALRLRRGTGRRTADAIVQAVGSRNPEALVGLTRENHRLYDQQVPRTRLQSTHIGVAWLAAIAGYVGMRLLMKLIFA